MATLELMLLEEDLYLLDEDGDFVLDDGDGEKCCCVEGGCCPTTLVIPTMADDPNATPLQVEIIDIETDVTTCCLEVSDVGTMADFIPAAPLIWKCCTLKPTCIAGITLTCADDTPALQWNPTLCPGLPANPLGFDAWEIISIECDPFEWIFKYTFTQAMPNPCQGWTITVKVTKQP